MEYRYRLVVLDKLDNLKMRSWTGISIFLPGLLILLNFHAQSFCLSGQLREKANPDVQVVKIVAERFRFLPSKVHVKRDTNVEIELTSEDTFHGFRISQTKIDVTIPARNRGAIKIRFRARRPGRYFFECSRPCGAGHNMMRGVIIVD